MKPIHYQMTCIFHIKYLLFLFLIASSPYASAQDLSLFKKKEFADKNGVILPYRILYPENYDRNQKYPLVLFLHGGGERGNDNEKQLTHGVKIFLESVNRKQFPCIIIAPQCPSDSYWASAKFERTTYPINFDFNYQYEITTGLDLAIQLTKNITKNESVDKKRVYVTGLSMGGMGTFEAVFRYPKLFAAAAPVCGGGDVNAYGKKQANIPFWLFHGDIDGVVSVDNSRNMYKKLQELGADVKYTEYTGVNHNSWENAYADKDLLAWLFSKHRFHHLPMKRRTFDHLTSKHNHYELLLSFKNSPVFNNQFPYNYELPPTGAAIR